MVVNEPLKRTPLYAVHVKAGARMVVSMQHGGANVLAQAEFPAFVRMVEDCARAAGIPVVDEFDVLKTISKTNMEAFRSLYVAVRHPLLGIGMGNYASEMSYSGLVTHNAYTQVAAEMGTTALFIYTMFVVTPLKRLGQIARATFDGRATSRHYYLALGLQASLLAYLVSSFFASVEENAIAPVAGSAR